MTVVSSKEFASHQKKYFDLARNDKVVIKRGKNLFHLIGAPIENASGYDEILEPDEDFYGAITMDEFKKRALEIVEKVHNQFYST
jgi:predicted transcriptional regulator